MESKTIFLVTLSISGKIVRTTAHTTREEAEKRQDHYYHPLAEEIYDTEHSRTAIFVHVPVKNYVLLNKLKSMGVEHVLASGRKRHESPGDCEYFFSEKFSVDYLLAHTYKKLTLQLDHTTFLKLYEGKYFDDFELRADELTKEDFYVSSCRGESKSSGGQTMETPKECYELCRKMEAKNWSTIDEHIKRLKDDSFRKNYYCCSIDVVIDELEVNPEPTVDLRDEIETYLNREERKFDIEQYGY